jgi:hypothetical protein
MIVNNRMIIRRLLDSRNGTHLTAYLSLNDLEAATLPEQIRLVLKRATGLLDSAMSADEKDEFLRPVRQLLNSHSTLALMQGNIGLFRTRDSFHVLRLPIEVRTSCVVASSFYVKPLLKWLQMDQRFLLLGLDENEAQLYSCNQHSYSKLDSFVYRDSGLIVNSLVKGPRRLTPSQRIRPLIMSVHEWLDQLTKTDKPKLFVAGERHLTDVFIRARHYRNIDRNPVWSSFSANQIPLIVNVIRKMNRREQLLKLDREVLGNSEAVTVGIKVLSFQS